MNKLSGALSASLFMVGVALSGHAAAQNSFSTAPAAPVADPNRAIANFDIASVGAVLTELGVTWQTMTAQDGTPIVAANVAGALIFYLQPTACQGANNTNCIGLNTLAFFDGAANPQTVRAFNDRYAFVSAGLMSSGGGAYISRYDIADYGIPRGNVASSVLNFVTLADNFQSELASASQTVAFEGYAADLSSSFLNKRGIEKLTGAHDLPSNSLDLHQSALEESLQQILMLSTDKTFPHNKIRNTVRD